LRIKLLRPTIMLAYELAV